MPNQGTSEGTPGAGQMNPLPKTQAPFAHLNKPAAVPEGAAAAPKGGKAPFEGQPATDVEEDDPGPMSSWAPLNQDEDEDEEPELEAEAEAEAEPETEPKTPDPDKAKAEPPAKDSKDEPDLLKLLAKQLGIDDDDDSDEAPAEEPEKEEPAGSKYSWDDLDPQARSEYNAAGGDPYQLALNKAQAERFIQKLKEENLDLRELMAQSRPTFDRADYVARLTALVREQHPTWSKDEIDELVEEKADAKETKFRRENEGRYGDHDKKLKELRQKREQAALESQQHADQLFSWSKRSLNTQSWAASNYVSNFLHAAIGDGTLTQSNFKAKAPAVVEQAREQFDKDVAGYLRDVPVGRRSKALTEAIAGYIEKDPGLVQSLLAVAVKAARKRSASAKPGDQNSPPADPPPPLTARVAAERAKERNAFRLNKMPTEASLERDAAELRRKAGRRN